MQDEKKCPKFKNAFKLDIYFCKIMDSNSNQRLINYPTATKMVNFQVACAKFRAKNIFCTASKYAMLLFIYKKFQKK